MSMKMHRALQFATKAHDGQYRKGSKTPYIVHPFEVSHILTQMNADENIVIAGLLHDTIEDTEITYDDIKANFGDYIANLVISNSENKALSWEERKQHTIEFMGNNAAFNTLQITFSDKLSNIRSLQNDYEVLGDELWLRFKRGYNKQKWYYGELMKIFDVEKLKPWHNEYVEIYMHLFSR